MWLNRNSRATLCSVIGIWLQVPKKCIINRTGKYNMLQSSHDVDCFITEHRSNASGWWSDRIHTGHLRLLNLFSCARELLWREGIGYDLCLTQSGKWKRSVLRVIEVFFFCKTAKFWYLPNKSQRLASLKQTPKQIQRIDMWRQQESSEGGLGRRAMTFVRTPTSLGLKAKYKMGMKYTLSRQVKQLRCSLHALLPTSTLSRTGFNLKGSHLLRTC